MSVVPWGGVWEYEILISWVNSVPVVEGDVLVALFEMPGAFDVSAPNVLATPLGVIGPFTWGFFVKDNF